MKKWIEVALKEYGEQETAGPGNNPRVIEYHKATDLEASEDAVPWCSAFVCWVLEQCGLPTTRSAAARSWLKYGTPVEKFEVGCIVVLKRGTNPAEGHVGFAVSERGNLIYLISGNQSDMVCVKAFNKADVIGYRLIPE